MPELALILCGSWAVLLFGVRSILQWRKTGSTGFNGFHGRIGSLEWVAGFSITAGLVVTPLAPLSTLLNWPASQLFFENTTVHLIGAGLTVIGIIGALAAQITMGDSWRVGVNPADRTALVTTGIFTWVRNPIFSFIGVSLIGLLLIVPTPLAVTAIFLTLCGIEIQVRSVEEPYLLAGHGEVYQGYANHVGRFFPRVGKGLGTHTEH